MNYYMVYKNPKGKVHCNQLRTLEQAKAQAQAYVTDGRASHAVGVEAETRAEAIAKGLPKKRKTKSVEKPDTAAVDSVAPSRSQHGSLAGGYVGES